MNPSLGAGENCALFEGLSLRRPFNRLDLAESWISGSRSLSGGVELAANAWHRNSFRCAKLWLLADAMRLLAGTTWLLAGVMRLLAGSICSRVRNIASFLYARLGLEVS